MEEEIDRVLATGADPVDWLELLPNVRAAFEEAMRLYPPAPSINRAAIADDEWLSPKGEKVEIPAGITVIEYLTNLDQIGAPRCRFMALPLRIEGADGSPVRAVAFVE